MDFYINLKVNFRGNSKNFLLSGSETKSWESMEAMVRQETITGARSQTPPLIEHRQPAAASVYKRCWWWCWDCCVDANRKSIRTIAFAAK